MSRNEVTNVNDIDQLANLLVTRKIDDGDSWALESRGDNKWVDEAAGEAWWKLMHQVEDELKVKYPNHRYYGDDPESLAYNAEYEARVEAVKPEQRWVTEWYLNKRGDNKWGITRIYLSVELGERLDTIWTKRPMYRGSKTMNRIGGMTIRGMMKRLGVSDKTVVAKMKAAEDLRARRDAAMRRNNWRSNICDKAGKLAEMLSQDGAVDLYGGVVDVEALKAALATLMAYPVDETLPTE